MVRAAHGLQRMHADLMLKGAHVANPALKLAVTILVWHRFIAVDHHTGDIYAVALAELADTSQCTAADSWLVATSRQIKHLQGSEWGDSSSLQSPDGPYLKPARAQWADNSPRQPDQQQAQAQLALPGCSFRTCIVPGEQHVRSHVVPHPRPASPPQGGAPEARSPAQMTLAVKACAAQLPGLRRSAVVDMPKAASPVVKLQQHVERQSLSDAQPEGPSACLTLERQAAIIPSASSAPSAFHMRRTRRQYLRDVHACLKELHAGNSYELCLTCAIECSNAHGIDARVLYSTLRHINPAPHAAFLRFGGTDPLTVCTLPLLVSLRTLVQHCLTMHQLGVALIGFMWEWTY